MGILVVAILAVVFDLLSFLPSLAWCSIIGFVMGIAVWVLGRKTYLYDRGNKRALAAMVIGIVATALGGIAILLSFVIGAMLEGFVGMGAY